MMMNGMTKGIAKSRKMNSTISFKSRLIVLNFHREHMYAWKVRTKSFHGDMDLLLGDSILPLDLQDNDSDHQGQVKVLLTKTADSLDDVALGILFVSVQQNNLELCLTYAVKQYAFNIPKESLLILIRA
jgi:hypothetical protein